MVFRQTALETQAALFEQARRVFLEDGEHARTVFLIERGKVRLMDLIPIYEAPADNPDAGYYETLAEAVSKHRAEAVIVIAEGRVPGGGVAPWR